MATAGPRRLGWQWPSPTLKGTADLYESGTSQLSSTDVFIAAATRKFLANTVEHKEEVSASCVTGVK